MRKRIVLGATTALAVAAAGAVAEAAGPPPPPQGVGGASISLFASGVKTPTAFAFGPGGAVFEADGGNNQKGPPNGGVYALSNGGAVKLAGSPQFVAGLAWHAGALYLSGGSITATGAKFQIQRWSGWNASSQTFSSQKVLYTAPERFQGFNGLTFGPDGRLYVGVDLGLLNNNDHGPAGLSPYLYDILSMNAQGGAVKVFARGIRQPWQMAFVPGTRTLVVSDLGQDAGVKNPLDAVLKVHQGDRFGFPKCSWTPASKCPRFTKPFQLFAPHTDLMGVAIIGKTLYLTSFQGPGAKGGGVLYAMPLRGGRLRAVAKGFVAPTVGLGTSGGYLYVGELTGQVFKVKP